MPDIRDTQLGWEVLADGRLVRASQLGYEILTGGDVLHATQLGYEILVAGRSMRLTQLGHETAIPVTKPPRLRPNGYSATTASVRAEEEAGYADTSLRFRAALDPAFTNIIAEVEQSGPDFRVFRLTGLTTGVPVYFRAARRNPNGSWSLWWSETVTVTPRAVAPPFNIFTAPTAGKFVDKNAPVQVCWDFADGVEHPDPTSLRIRLLMDDEASEVHLLGAGAFTGMGGAGCVTLPNLLAFADESYTFILTVDGVDHFHQGFFLVGGATGVSGCSSEDEERWFWPDPARAGSADYNILEWRAQGGNAPWGIGERISCGQAVFTTGPQSATVQSGRLSPPTDGIPDLIPDYIRVSGRFAIEADGRGRFIGSSWEVISAEVADGGVGLSGVWGSIAARVGHGLLSDDVAGRCPLIYKGYSEGGVFSLDIAVNGQPGVSLSVPIRVQASFPQIPCKDFGDVDYESIDSTVLILAPYNSTHGGCFLYHVVLEARVVGDQLEVRASHFGEVLSATVDLPEDWDCTVPQLLSGNTVNFVDEKGYRSFAGMTVTVCGEPGENCPDDLIPPPIIPPEEEPGQNEGRCLYFFGRRHHHAILLADVGTLDHGLDYPVLLRTHLLAPAGFGGECVFSRLYVQVRRLFGQTFTVEPIIDGRRLGPVSIQVPPDLIDHGTVTYEIVLAREGGRSRRGVRGGVLQAELRTTAPITDEWLEWFGCEAEYTVVRESHPNITPVPHAVRDGLLRPPRQLFLGGRGDDGIYTMDRGRSDLGTAITARARTHHFAPASIGGEAIFPVAYLVVSRANPTDLQLRVTPIVDAVAYDAVILTLPGISNRVTAVHEIQLHRSHRRSRHALRGEWIQFLVETVGGLPDGDVVLDGIEIEYELVTESKPGTFVSIPPVVIPPEVEPLPPGSPPGSIILNGQHGGSGAGGSLTYSAISTEEIATGSGSGGALTYSVPVPEEGATLDSSSGTGGECTYILLTENASGDGTGGDLEYVETITVDMASGDGSGGVLTYEHADLHERDQSSGDGTGGDLEYVFTDAREQDSGSGAGGSLTYDSAETIEGASGSGVGGSLSSAITSARTAASSGGTGGAAMYAVRLTTSGTSGSGSGGSCGFQAAPVQVTVASAAGAGGSLSFSIAGPPGDPSWPNEPGGMTLIVASDWSEPGVWQDLGGTDQRWSGNGFTRKTADLQVVNIGDHPITGAGRALQIVTPQGTVGGFGPWGYHTGETNPGVWGTGWREIYIGWWAKLAANFYGHASGSNKHCNIWGRADWGGRDSFWAMPWAAFHPPGGLFGLRNDASAGIWIGENDGVCGHSTNHVNDVFRAGVWAKFEMWYRKPTVRGPFGEWRVWKDGVLIVNRTNICDFAFSPLSYLDGIGFHGTWGGGSDVTLPQDNFQWFANFRVSGRTPV